ncbi:MAG: hypothetical protein EZS28_034739, partial [Streblomastix strix]
AGLISDSNSERTDPQLNEGNEDNGKEEKDEQADEAALNLNKDYRINLISLPLVQKESSQMEKNNPGPAPNRVQEKPKKGKRSRKSKTEGLNASGEPIQGSNAQAQTKTTSKVPKPKAMPKRGK